MSLADEISCFAVADRRSRSTAGGLPQAQRSIRGRISRKANLIPVRVRIGMAASS